MPVRRVQRREVVVRVLDLGPVEDLVAEPDEDVLDLAADLGDQVEVAARDGVTGEGDVDLLLGERAVELAGAQLLARPGGRLLERRLRPVQLGALLDRERPSRSAARRSACCGGRG